MEQEFLDLKEQITEIGTECLKVEAEWKGKDMPENIGESLEAKYKEAETLQEKADRLARGLKLAGYTGGLGLSDPDSIRPGADVDDPNEVKARGFKDDIVGYARLSDVIRRSPFYQANRGRGFKGQIDPVALPGLFGGSKMAEAAAGLGFIPVTREFNEQLKAWTEETNQQLKALEGKAVPTLGTGVIPEDRVAGLWRVTEDTEPSIRDLITVRQTSSDTIEYVREDSFTRAAAETAHGSAKPEAAVVYSKQTAPVRTIAVHIPVQTQQLDDFGQLRGLLDDRLRYDVRKREAEEIFYGDGSAPNIEALIGASGINDIQGNGRWTTSTSTLDAIRMGVTDVMTSGYRANGVGIHPLDWEGIVLSKGSDTHYLGQIFPDGERGLRVWGLRVVELFELEEQASVVTPQRHMIVGDWRRGAVLYDRMAAQIFVGVIDDQFIKNMRTILCEERIALALHAPAAFAELLTRSASAS